MESQKRINGMLVRIVLADMTTLACDAYIVPQFQSSASFGGVGGAVARKGARAGMEEYHGIAERQGELPFGKVYVTKSGGGNAKYLLHAVSVNSSRDEEFNTVQTCVYSAMAAMNLNDLRTIAAPAMGTGIIGDLTAEQSARAMLSAVHRYTSASNLRTKNVEFTIAIYGDQDAFQTFARILKDGSYQDAADETGARPFDIARWEREIEADAQANKKAFSH